MSAMKEFVLWFLNQLPTFFLSEPICYVVGFAFAILTIALIKQIISLGRR